MIRFLLFAGLAAALYFLVKRMLSQGGEMSVDEAAKLLGVSPDADADAIAEAHRRLIAKVHPDAGGNAELAQRINRARDVLMRRLSP